MPQLKTADNDEIPDESWHNINEAEEANINTTTLQEADEHDIQQVDPWQPRHCIHGCGEPMAPSDKK